MKLPTISLNKELKPPSNTMTFPTKQALLLIISTTIQTIPTLQAFLLMISQTKQAFLLMISPTKQAFLLMISPTRQIFPLRISHLKHAFLLIYSTPLLLIMFLSPNISNPKLLFLFYYLKPHAKFQNSMITFSG